MLCRLVIYCFTFSFKATFNTFKYSFMSSCRIDVCESYVRAGMLDMCRLEWQGTHRTNSKCYSHCVIKKELETNEKRIKNHTQRDSLCKCGYPRSILDALYGLPRRHLCLRFLQLTNNYIGWIADYGGGDASKSTADFSRYYQREQTSLSNVVQCRWERMITVYSQRDTRRERRISSLAAGYASYMNSVEVSNTKNLKTL